MQAYEVIDHLKNENDKQATRVSELEQSLRQKDAYIDVCVEHNKNDDARIAALEARVKDLAKTLDLIMEVHPTKNKDNYPFIVRQLVQMNETRALLERTDGGER